MPLKPHQQAIWLVMWARNLSFAGVAFILSAAFAILGFRFMDHQILVGFVVGAALIWAGDRIIRYIPGPAAED